MTDAAWMTNPVVVGFASTALVVAGGLIKSWFDRKPKIDRLREAADAAVKTALDGYKDYIATMTNSYEQRIATMTEAYEKRIADLTAEIHSLRQEVSLLTAGRAARSKPVAVASPAL